MFGKKRDIYGTIPARCSPRPFVLPDDEEAQLLSLASSWSLPHRLVQPAQIVLDCGQGRGNTSVARRMRLSYTAVGKWLKRYVMQGIRGGAR